MRSASFFTIRELRSWRLEWWCFMWVVEGRGTDGLGQSSRKIFTSPRTEKISMYILIVHISGFGSAPF
jgi:hypothetical protein